MPIDVAKLLLDFTKPLDDQLSVGFVDEYEKKAMNKLGRNLEIAARLQDLADNGIDADLPKWREWCYTNQQWALERKNALISYVKIVMGFNAGGIP